MAGKRCPSVIWHRCTSSLQKVCPVRPGDHALLIRNRLCGGPIRAITTLRLCRSLGRSWIVCGRVATDHQEHAGQNHHERGRPVVRHRSFWEGEADDHRARQIDSAEDQHDSKAPGGESELTLNPARSQRKNGQAQAYDQDQAECETAHGASVSEGIEADKAGPRFILTPRSVKTITSSTTAQSGW